MGIDRTQEEQHPEGSRFDEGLDGFDYDREILEPLGLFEPYEDDGDEESMLKQAEKTKVKAKPPTKRAAK